MTRAIKFFFLIGVAGGLILSQQAAATVVFYDDFEDDTVGDSSPNAPPVGDSWHPYYGETPKRYVANNPESETRNMSSQALFMSRLADMGGDPHSHIQAMISAADQALIQANGQVTVEYKYYDAGEAGAGSYGLSVNANNGGPSYYAPSAADLSFLEHSSLGNVIRGAGEAYCDLTYEFNTWHDMKVDIDLTSNTYTLSVDGVMQTAPVSYNSPGGVVPVIDNVLWSPGYLCHAYIDEVTISTVPEPSALLLLIAGALSCWTVICRRKR